MSAATSTTTTVWDLYESPFGTWALEATPRGISAIRFEGRGKADRDADRDPGALAPLASQLDEYFAGDRQAFDLTLDFEAHDDRLARQVWQQLLRIPYGETTTYGELGKRIGHGDPRDIGSCVGATPIPVVVPCHRVIGADGSLRGYRGGLPLKESLLTLEHRGSGSSSTPVWARGEQLGLI